MRHALAVLAVAVSLGGAGCGERVLKAAGESCTASSECGALLLCDFGQTPAVCAGNSSIADANVTPGFDAEPGAIDAAVIVFDAALPDAAPLDADESPDAEI